MSPVRKTVNMLYDGFMSSEYEFLESRAVHCDFYGMNVVSEEDISRLTSIYQSLICTCGVKKEMLENCFKTNRLDALIRVYFCDEQLTIGRTYLPSRENQVDELPLPNPDACPNCSAPGFITEQHRTSPPDCSMCYAIICKRCSARRQDAYVCNACRGHA